jgi:hypothetical protein
VSETVIARMKPIAAHLPAAVAGLDRDRLDELLANAPTARELRALIVILADAADPAKLAEATDYLAPIDPQVAHAIFARLKQQRAWRIPAHVLNGERTYQAQRKREQRQAVA